MVPLGVINGSERLRGIDLSKACDVAEVKDMEKKKGWQRFGLDHEEFPPLRAKICEAKTASAEPAEIEWVKERLQILKGLEERGKASGTVCASEFALLSVFVRSVAYTCIASYFRTLPGNVISIVCIIGMAGLCAVGDCRDSRGQ